MSRTIRIGTRQSRLALEQTKLVAAALKAVHPELEVELMPRVTKGDRILNKPLQEFGGKGVFVMEFEEALLSGEIDFAVHSAKDLPMELADGLGVVAVPEREDARDVLVTRPGTVMDGKKKILVGTSSLRRQLHIAMLRDEIWPGSDVRCENLRGNVQTRLEKLAAGEFDAIILAAAGLKRLGLLKEESYKYHFFTCEEFIPAGGQGILAIEGRLDDPISQLCAGIADEETAICLRLERNVLRLLDAGCHEPVGVYSRITDGIIELLGINQRNGETKQVHLFGGLDEAGSLAETAAKGLK